MTQRRRWWVSRRGFLGGTVVSGAAWAVRRRERRSDGAVAVPEGGNRIRRVPRQIPVRSEVAELVFPDDHDLAG